MVIIFEKINFKTLIIFINETTSDSPPYPVYEPFGILF
jgi:hypothetical protein